MRTGLLGRHIQYSKSPEIHKKSYEKMRLPLTYELFDLPREDISHFIDTLSKENIVGFNVTIPYKETIIEYLHELDSTALECGAVNTVVIKNGRLIGYNTDVHGFTKSMEDHRISLAGKKVLVLGSGGAAKAVYTGLKKLDARITMGFRSVVRRKHFPEAVEIIPLSEIHDISTYDLVINCTKLGNINDDRIPIDITNYSDYTIFYDVNYEPEFSSFLLYGTSRGLKVINGESMLVNQALKAEELWIDALKLS